MGKQYLDRTGVRYGRLIAISPLKSYYSTGRAKWDWVCACDCGGSIWMVNRKNINYSSFIMNGKN